MLANFQFQVHVQLAAGKVLLVIDLCVGSPTSLAQHAHAHFHPSTTLLPSRDFPIQALLFPNFTSISFFIPPINTVFYLIERLIQYFILLNDCDKEQKKESLCRGYQNCVSSYIKMVQALRVEFFRFPLGTLHLQWCRPDWPRRISFIVWIYMCSPVRSYCKRISGILNSSIEVLNDAF